MTAMYKIGDFVEFVSPTKEPETRVAKYHFMLRMHPNYDLKAERMLKERGINAYVPKEKKTVKGVWNRRILRDVPIFAGILFIPDYDADLPRLKRIADGIGGFVRNGSEPIRISPGWMERIHRFEEKMQSSGKRQFKPGQNVRIVGGVFDLWEGRIERLDSHYRIRVLIETIMGEVPVDVDEGQVEVIT